MNTPDLTVFYLLHDAMRDDATLLTEVVTTVTPGERRRLRALSRWYHGYQAEIHSHHTIEDTIIYPGVAELVVDFADLTRRVDAEHVRLDAALVEAGRALDRLAGRPDDFAAARAQALAAVVEVRAILTTHLDYEDAALLPVIATRLTVEQYDALSKAAERSMPVRNLLFAVPWLLDRLPADQRDRLLADAPGLFGLLWRVSRGRYRRLRAAALGGAVAPLVSIPAPTG